MSLSDTSLLAYARLQPKLRKKYEAIVKTMEPVRGLEDWTGQELARTIPGAWKRLSEMERLGLIKKNQKRKCSVTGEYAWGWELA
jgi:hypothetical protein